MSKEEKDIGKRIAEIGKLLSSDKLEYLMGYADGVCAMADSLKQDEPESKTEG